MLRPFWTDKCPVYPSDETLVCAKIHLMYLCWVQSLSSEHDWLSVKMARRCVTSLWGMPHVWQTFTVANSRLQGSCTGFKPATGIPHDRAANVIDSTRANPNSDYCALEAKWHCSHIHTPHKLNNTYMLPLKYTQWLLIILRLHSWYKTNRFLNICIQIVLLTVIL